MQHQEPKNIVGLIVVLTGDGKGKTSSALGMALRAVGHKMRVCIIQFMKGDLYSGEIDGLKWLAPLVEFHQAGRGFCSIQGNPIPYHEHRANAQCAIELAREKIHSGIFELIILDEINNALKLRLLDLPQVLELLDTKPAGLQLVLTGRDAHPEVCERAHAVTEMRDVTPCCSSPGTS
ncbi:MAG: cob(I)yrinic acid a,c-diamide adenosyltransferase [Geobacteraceae bacterium GWC2_55_20]|nr:MAG: cob(I)yrinic acid a,c-diamide adenosyltransferase [Geobacteraceae bacterium GWC2_55_20]HCE69205.1 cob(I)yrinic acid a,c-diamide adenosyltransferase [Geobacter sp.]